MDHMMMLGIEIFNVDLYIWLLLLSGIFYLICAMVIWGPFKKENNELVKALFAFLIYQSFAMFFMGLEMWTMNILYGNIAALSVFIGSAYMLKFPFSNLSQKTRNIIFLTSLIILLSLFGWFMMTIERQHMLTSFILFYDIIINGIIVGGSIVFFSINVTERMRKRKSMIGGAGVLSCCMVANATMLTGALVTSAVFQFLAPILILSSIKFPKKHVLKTELDNK